MKKSFKLLNTVIIAGTLALGGCGSTPRTSKAPELLTTAKPITIYSTDEYNWKGNRSMALNIAEMARPAGAGFGLRDKADPTNGVQSEGSGSGILAFATGFFTGDILSGLGQVALGSKQDDLLKYNPYIIDFVPVDKIDINNSVATTDFLLADFGEKMKTAIEKSGIDAEFKGVYSYVVARSKRNSTIYLDGSFCREGADFLAPKALKGAKFKPSFSRTSALNLDPKITSSETSCNVIYETSIVGKLNNHYVIVHEMSSYNLALYLHSKIAPHSGMAFFFPELFVHLNYAILKTYNYRFPYAFVSYKGKQYLFDSKKDAKPLFE